MLKNIQKIKTTASLILMICIFLLLSQCNRPGPKNHKGEVEVTKSYIYGEAINIESMASVASWLLPLLLVFLSFKYGISIKLSVVEILASILAGFAWIVAVFWSNKILWPGYLSAMAIITIMAMVITQLVILIRARYIIYKVGLSLRSPTAVNRSTHK